MGQIVIEFWNIDRTIKSARALSNKIRFQDYCCESDKWGDMVS